MIELETDISPENLIINIFQTQKLEYFHRKKDETQWFSKCLVGDSGYLYVVRNDDETLPEMSHGHDSLSRNEWIRNGNFSLKFWAHNFSKQKS